MNEYVSAYMSAFQKGATWRSTLSGAIDSAGGALKSLGNSIGDYKPFSPENLANTGRWIGGLGAAVPGAILGGAAGTIKGWSESPYDEEGNRIRPGWFLRGLQGGAAGTLLGAGIGAGLGVAGGHFGFPSLFNDTAKDFVKKGPGELTKKVFGDFGPLGASEASRAGLLQFGQSLPLSEISKALKMPETSNFGDWVHWAYNNPDVAKRLGAQGAGGAWRHIREGAPEWLKKVIPQ